MLDLDFENGFWISTDWTDSTDTMWKNFKTYCKSKGNNNEIVLLTEFNAKAQRYVGDDDEDDQWFIRFNTPEDYTYFVMRFG